MQPLTVGVEEEFQLVDPASGQLVSRATEVLAALGDPDDEMGAIVAELPLSQVETVTPVLSTLDDVDRHLHALRTRAAAAAEQAGCALLASGTPPLAVVADQSVNTGARYASTLAQHDYLVHEQFIAGMHVHVGVGADDDVRVAVVDAVRGWLPVLTALAANSPYWQGTDTGFASFRTVHWWRWPVTGPPPRTRDAAGWHTAVAELVEAGAVGDASRVYWDVRLAARFPTVEVRVCDVTLTVEEAVVLTGLIRALAATALAGARTGRPPAEPSTELLRAAAWHAARYGLSGSLLHPYAATPQPSAQVVGDLLDRIAPALADAGDVERVTAGVHRLLSAGTGADRQRAAATGSVADVVRFARVETLR